MPLRCLQYVSEVYKRLHDNKALHSSRLLHIPQPEFFVLYNGVDPYPDDKILRLSEAFPGLGGLGLSEGMRPALELEVRVLNINKGRNTDIVKQCRELDEYSAFVAKMRDLAHETGNKEEAVQAAVRYCLEHDILRSFLNAHAKEVVGMQITEWHLEDALAVEREEGREEGLSKGREEGLSKGREALLETARKLQAMGLSAEQIVAVTGLSPEAFE